MNLGPYGKAVAAVAGVLALVLSDQVLDANDVILLLEAVLTPVLVYLIPNKPTAPPVQ